MDSYFDDIIKDTEHHACTHTHTCNPPVHDLSHTHTCVHVHTKIVAASPDAAETAESPSENNNASKKRPSGNRAAVRKYREKKKAHTASLEEVVHLRALNQQLMKKLQNHAALEAEVARLRCLLVDIRGRIEGEIGAFPYQRPVKNIDLVSSVDQGRFLGAAQVANSCDFRCNDQMYCNPGMQGAMVLRCWDKVPVMSQISNAWELQNLDPQSFLFVGVWIPYRLAAYQMLKRSTI
ncbi:hypothetical protein PVAP13_9NG366600 [Panicum virgatum]|uniref:BZIP domain-containing protein n=1 Tax=Panicum virgatum TaxID=38727 RepID=A0A8T0MUF2_PANVG|nr:hypothetical protein PVAP13_9NG366600 [Panicum virgatum]